MTLTNAKAVVTVFFTNGESEDFPITSHKGISAGLSERLQSTGTLTIWNDARSFCIPREQIRFWTIRDLTPEEQARERGETPEAAA